MSLVVGLQIRFSSIFQGKLDIGIYREPFHLWSTLADAYGMDFNATVPMPSLNYTPIGPMKSMGMFYNMKVFFCNSYSNKNLHCLVMIWQTGSVFFAREFSVEEEHVMNI